MHSATFGNTPADDPVIFDFYEHAILNGIRVKKFDASLQKKALRRLRYIDAAESIEDLRIPPSNKLEKKEGDLKDFYAIWVNTQWRIVFKWDDGEAVDVQLVDYH